MPNSGNRGFALAAALVAALLIAVLVAGALEETHGSSNLATAITLNYQTSTAAMFGVYAGATQLDSGLVPGDGQRFSLPPLRDGLTTHITWRHGVANRLPAGFSADRFQQRYEHLVSDASGPRQSHFNLTAGFKQVVPLEIP